MPLKGKCHSVTFLPKIFPQFPTAFRIVTKLLTMAYQAPHNLLQLHPTSSYSICLYTSVFGLSIAAPQITPNLSSLVIPGFD